MERGTEEEAGESVGAQGQGTGHVRLGRMWEAYILLPLFNKGRGEAWRGQQASRKACASLKAGPELLARGPQGASHWTQDCGPAATQRRRGGDAETQLRGGEHVVNRRSDSG